MIRLAITPGEPAGIGPDILLQLIQRPQPCELIAIADPSLLQERAHHLGLPLQLLPFDAHRSVSKPLPGTLTCLPIALRDPVTCGQLNPNNAEYVLQTLTTAADGCLSGLFDGLVTGPVQKSVINDAGIPFSGHTEFFAERSHTPLVVMMLATTKLRVALVTTHLPLSQVPLAITSDLLRGTLTILHNALRRQFGIPKPRIVVAGLNPHAGEGGYLGREEIEIIEPTLEECRRNGMQLIGPLPADTLFTPQWLGQADTVLAMYHDQGLPVLKSQGFGEAVNITLGLPFIRTSVDHGTALSLAGTGTASADSLKTAVDLAFHLATQQLTS